jgi:O-acetyl-ADP-ribose deacetylase (regulator of RNase III)
MPPSTPKGGPAINSLDVATELGAKSVAFPAISTGAYRWPVDSAAEIALQAAAG